MVAVQDPRMADRRRSACARSAGPGITGGEVGAADRRHDAGRPGRASRPVGRRPRCHPGLDRSNDRVRPRHAVQQPRRPFGLGGSRAGADRPRLGTSRRRPLRRLWRRRLSGRDGHPAADLWQDRGFGRARPALGSVHHLRRPVGPGDRRPTLRCGPPTAGRGGPHRWRHGSEHGGVVGHHRRLVRLAGGQCGRRDCGRQFRLHRPDPAQRLWL